jgi:hypothetical protein
MSGFDPYARKLVVVGMLGGVLLSLIVYCLWGYFICRPAWHRGTCRVPMSSVVNGYWDSTGDHSEVLVINLESRELSSHVSSHDGEVTLSTEYIISKASMKDDVDKSGNVLAELHLIPAETGIQSIDDESPVAGGEGALCGRLVLSISPATGEMHVVSWPKKSEPSEASSDCSEPLDLGVFIRDNFMSLEIE